jgi:hypothetical protein
MNIQEFLFNKGLESVSDDFHKHPHSGSDWSIRSLLESFEGFRKPNPDAFQDFINSKSDACSLEATAAEKTDKEWREYVKSL